LFVRNMISAVLQFHQILLSAETWNNQSLPSAAVHVPAMCL